MRTQILQLETYDDLVSTCDKMKWAKADRILLVWPDRKKFLNRKMDLLILKRQSISQGAQLALVTRDHRICNLAHQQGIPTFSTIRCAQSEAWRLPHRYRKLQDFYSPVRHDLSIFRTPYLPKALSNLSEKNAYPSPLVRLLFFTIGVLAFLSLATMLYPSATITLQPNIQWQEASLIVIPDERISQVRIDGRAPVSKILVTVEGRDSLPVTGEILFADTHAIGEVLFTNLTDLPLEIPPGIIVRSANGRRFETTDETRIAAGSGETATAPVRSLLPGSAGNLPADAIDAIEGSLSTFASVNNPKALHSGSDKRLPAAAKSDSEKLSRKLREELLASAMIQLKEQLSPGDYLIPDSVHLMQTLEEAYIPADNSPTNQLTLNLRLEYQAAYISTKHLEELFYLVFDATPLENSESIPGSFAYEIIPENDNPLSSSEGIRVTGRRKVRETFKPAQIVAHVIGLTPEQAQKKLSDRYSLDNPALIQTTPKWWPRLPFIPLRITIRVIG
jgi:hypothetical protein